MLDAGVDLRDVQIAARHADPRTMMRYDGARQNLDRHPNYILATYMASGISGRYGFGAGFRGSALCARSQAVSAETPPYHIVPVAGNRLGNECYAALKIRDDQRAMPSGLVFP
jgi:hypothetical protein